MKKRILFINSVIILLFFSCSKEKNTSTPEALGLTVSVAECNETILQICNDGLSFAKIGDSLLTVKTNISEIKGVKDSTIETEDYTAFVRVIYFEEGNIVLEGTHFEKEVEKADLAKSHVALIRITTPEIQTPEKIRVGGTFAELKKIYADSLFETQPGAVSGSIFLRIPKVSRLNYELRQSKNTEQAPGGEVGEAGEVSPDARIEAISLY